LTSSRRSPGTKAPRSTSRSYSTRLQCLIGGGVPPAHPPPARPPVPRHHAPTDTPPGAGGNAVLYPARAPSARHRVTKEDSMTLKGFSHIGLSTRDLDRTRDFYENVLGFEAVRCDILEVKEGGRIRHIFCDTGRDQLLAFMEAQEVPGVPVDYDAGINRGLGVPNAFYHFAFEAGSEAALDAKSRAVLAL